MESNPLLSGYTAMEMAKKDQPNVRQTVIPVKKVNPGSRRFSM
jgi:hypothetical protein